MSIFARKMEAAFKMIAKIIFVGKMGAAFTMFAKIGIFAVNLLIAAVLLCSPLMAEGSGESLLPRSCAEGWVAEGKIAVYGPDDLYEYIDGEAELYLPYGFERADTVMYSEPGRKGTGLVANVFKMGSLLDAFGIYSNYRSGEAEPAKTGAAGFIEESQLMFYQGRYFVQVIASGGTDQPSSSFLACAAGISRRLPGGTERPRELDFLRVPGLVAGSERYYAQGLLGYGFFGPGLTAEASSDKGKVKLFVMLGRSADSTKGAVEAYARQLTESKASFRVTEGKGGRRLAANDPLYKGILLQQSGPFAAGVAGLANPDDGKALLEQLLLRLQPSQLN